MKEAHPLRSFSLLPISKNFPSIEKRFSFTLTALAIQTIGISAIQLHLAVHNCYAIQELSGCLPASTLRSALDYPHNSGPSLNSASDVATLPIKSMSEPKYTLPSDELSQLLDFSVGKVFFRKFLCQFLNLNFIGVTIKLDSLILTKSVSINLYFILNS